MAVSCFKQMPSFRCFGTHFPSWAFLGTYEVLSIMSRLVAHEGPGTFPLEDEGRDRRTVKKGAFLEVCWFNDSSRVVFCLLPFLRILHCKESI